ncbi:MAG: type II toxin-antitoxin system VapC family toxin [Desulfobacteraceae bacterium]|nr:type II toxin-antitoxin system VapC family toxin [Desulfobacteraceae bacterium]
MISYILDSDHLSLHQRGYEPLGKRLLIAPYRQTHITIISVEELLRGRLAQIRRATKSDDRLKAYNWLSRTFEYLAVLLF